MIRSNDMMGSEELKDLQMLQRGLKKDKWYSPRRCGARNPGCMLRTARLAFVSTLIHKSLKSSENFNKCYQNAK